MNTLMIVMAIFVALILFFKHVASPKKLIVRNAERLNDDALLLRVAMLAKHSVKTKSGFGVDTNIKFTEASGISDEAWSRAYAGNIETVERIFKKSAESVRLSYTTGHADGYPRLYLLCNEIVYSTGGDPTARKINKCFEVYERYAPLTDAEKNMAKDMLLFCLCAFLHGVVISAKKRDRRYAAGKKDGEKNKFDLDRIHDADYIVGVCETTEKSERSAVYMLLESNGVDISAAVRQRNIELAETYADVRGVLRAYDEVSKSALRVEKQEETKQINESKYMFLNIAPLVIMAILSVFACIFVPAKYVAVVIVAEIIVFGAFRLSLLLYAPKKFFKLPPIFDRAKKVRAVSETPSDDMVCETAYFGGEAEHYEQKLFGGVNITADNGGIVNIENIGELSIVCRTPHGDIRLSDCDAVAEKHRIIYYAVNADIEFAAEIFAPVTEKCCLVRVAAVERNGNNISVQVEIAIENKSDKTVSVRFFGDEVNGAADGNASASCELKMQPFSREVISAVVAFGRGSRQANSIVKNVMNEGFYEFADDCARVFCASSALPVNSTHVFRNEVHETESGDRWHFGDLTDPVKLSYADGVLTENGKFFSSAESGDGKNGIVTRNVLGNVVRAVCDDRGIILDIPSVKLRGMRTYCVVQAEEKCFSPTVIPSGSGELYAEHGSGYSEYGCIYDGIRCGLKCFERNDGIFFELSLSNIAHKKRNISVMFSVVAPFDKTIKKEYGMELVKNGDRFFIASSEAPTAFTEYKEGYFKYGRIFTAKSFRVGGNTVAPTLSVDRVLPPFGESMTVAFYIGSDDIACRGMTAGEAHSSFAETIEKYDRFFPIKPNTDNAKLDFLYRMAFYRSVHEYEIGDLENECIILSAIKYYDAGIVKRRLCEIFSAQALDGKLFGATDENKNAYFDVLRLLFEYIDFARDGEFLGKALPFAHRNNDSIKYATVKVHALRAADIAVKSINNCEKDISRNICRDKTAIAVMKRMSELCDPYGKRRENYICALSVVASRQAKNIMLMSHAARCDGGTFLRALVCARALFDADCDKKGAEALEVALGMVVDGRYVPTVAECALYFTTLTEQYFGVRQSGNYLSVSPNISSDKDFLLDIKVRDGYIRINVRARGVGSWKTKFDKVVYSPCCLDITKSATDDQYLLYKCE